MAQLFQILQINKNKLFGLKLPAMPCHGHPIQALGHILMGEVALVAVPPWMIPWLPDPGCTDPMQHQQVQMEIHSQIQEWEKLLTILGQSSKASRKNY